MWSQINNKIDNFLNGITMYRLVLYLLLILVAIASVFGGATLIPYSPFSIIFSALFITIMCLATNTLFAGVYNAPVNSESVYITALILALIVTPATSINGIIVLGWVSILAMTSKYILAVNKKHIFNPVAIAVALMALFANQSASWWVGSTWMTPFVAISAYLIARKIRRLDMVWTLLLTIFSFTLGFAIIKGSSLVTTFSTLIYHSSLLFFTGLMFTEPLTSPTTKNWQSVFSVITGILYLPQMHLGPIYSTPELALVAANFMAFIVSPKHKLLLELKQKLKIAPDTYDFIFPLISKIKYTPGQYMEWTLPHNHPDDRGNRRYFTLASSPTEDNLRLGIKFYQSASSYKLKMLEVAESPIVASQLAGDFTLPADPLEKCVFMAGGIGITPFRSMLKYLVDTKQKRDIVMFFSNKTADEIVYQDVFDAAQNELGIKTIYTITDKNQIPLNWQGSVGRIDDLMIKKFVPDYLDRKFYLSGPRVMVTSYETLLESLGVKKVNIKTDFFPGFA